MRSLLPRFFSAPVQRFGHLPRLVLVGMLAFAGGLAFDRLLLELTWQTQRAALTYVATATLTGLAAVPWIVGAHRKSIDLMELVYPFSLLYFVEFGGRTIWILLNRKAMELQTPHPSVIAMGLLPAIVAASLGLAAYLVAYYLPDLRRRAVAAPRTPSPDGGTLAWLALAIYGAGLAFRAPLLFGGWFMGFAAGRYASQVSPTVHSLAYLGILSVMGYALAFVTYYRPGGHPAWFRRVLWLGIVPLETLYTFLVGSKFFFAVLLFMPIVVYHYLRRPIRLTRLALVLAFFLLVVTPLVSAYRLVADSGNLTIKTFATGFPRLVASLLGRLLSFSPREYLDASIGVAVTRFVGIDALAAVMRGIPVLTDFQHGQSLLWMVKILIPTFVWPGKYDALELDLAPVPRFFGFEDFSRGGLSITQPAEFYWNFGLPGVIVGMALVGLFQRFVVATLRRPMEPLRIYLYALVWVWIVLSFEGWTFALYPNIVRILALGTAVVWVGTKLAAWERRRASASEEYAHPQNPTPR